MLDRDRRNIILSTVTIVDQGLDSSFRIIEIRGSISDVVNNRNILSLADKFVKVDTHLVARFVRTSDHGRWTEWFLKNDLRNNVCVVRPELGWAFCSAWLVSGTLAIALLNVNKNKNSSLSDFRQLPCNGVAKISARSNVVIHQVRSLFCLSISWITAKVAVRVHWINEHHGIARLECHDTAGNPERHECHVDESADDVCASSIFVRSWKII